jgi:serine phosphatase RsbU (regulator of sigma subunit)
MQGLVSALTRAVADFSAGARQSDDITLLALRYMGPSGVR